MKPHGIPCGFCLIPHQATTHFTNSGGGVLLVAEYFIKQLKASDLGWWTEAENNGKAAGNQRGVNLNKSVYPRMFPKVTAKDFTVKVTFRDGDSAEILTEDRRIKEEQKNMRLVGSKIPGADYGNLDPDDFMIMKVDGLNLTWAVVMNSVEPGLHTEVKRLLKGSKMSHITGTDRTKLTALLKGYDPELFGLGTVRPLSSSPVALPAQTDAEEAQWEDALDKMSDQEFEAWKQSISGAASLQVKKRMVKIRQASRVVTDKLRKQYNYRCQICGHDTSPAYGVPTVEAHHIEPFVKKQNHHPSNILILCPNHHRLWHAAGGSLDKTKLEVVYTNGYRESITLHQADHLVPGMRRP